MTVLLDPALHRVALHATLSLPSAVLRGLSGGNVVYIGGRTLDPRLQFLAALAASEPPLAGLTPLEVRAAVRRTLAPLLGRPPSGVRIESLIVPGGTGDAEARAYRGVDQDPEAPLLVFAHLGAGVVGDLDVAEPFCALLAARARCPVLSVDYRLAPEHRYPAGLEDFLAATRWARDNTARFGARPGHFAVGGESIGAGFAAVAALEMTRAGEPPSLQLLICPLLDVASESASVLAYARAWPFGRAAHDAFMGHYVGADSAPDDPRVSPLRVEDLAGLPPAVIAGAGFDPLLDQGEAYARRLLAAGVPVTYRRWDSLANGFTAFTGAVPQAQSACNEIADLVRRSVSTPMSPALETVAA